MVVSTVAAIIPAAIMLGWLVFQVSQCSFPNLGGKAEPASQATAAIQLKLDGAASLPVGTTAIRSRSRGKLTFASVADAPAAAGRVRNGTEQLQDAGDACMAPPLSDLDQGTPHTPQPEPLLQRRPPRFIARRVSLPTPCRLGANSSSDASSGLRD